MNLKERYLWILACTMLVLLSLGVILSMWIRFQKEESAHFRSQLNTKKQVEKLQAQVEGLTNQYSELDVRFKALEAQYGIVRKVDYYIAMARIADKEKPLSFAEAEAVGTKVVELATRYDIPHEDLLALWRLESRFQKDAVGKLGERGLGQVMERTFQGFGEGSFLCWESVAEASAKYWVYLRKLFGSDLDRRISSYNTGPALTREETVRRSGKYVAVVSRYRREALTLFKY